MLIAHCINSLQAVKLKTRTIFWPLTFTLKKGFAQKVGGSSKILSTVCYARSIHRVVFDLLCKSRTRSCTKSPLCTKSIEVAQKVSYILHAMCRLIQHLGIAVITFILGLFAFDLWTTLNPPKVDSPACYHLMPRVMIMDADGRTHCEGGETIRIPNCP